MFIWNVAVGTHWLCHLPFTFRPGQDCSNCNYGTSTNFKTKMKYKFLTKPLALIFSNVKLKPQALAVKEKRVQTDTLVDV